MHAVAVSEIPFHSLDALYAWCNERYFQNQLPACRIVWSGRLKSTYAFFEWKTKVGAGYPEITLSRRLQGAWAELLDTVVHEMIHVWQYSQYIKSGETKYLDIHPVDGAVFHSSWHGRFFYGWVDHINRKFPEMNLVAEREGFPNDLGLRIERKYGVHISFNHGGDIEEALFSSGVSVFGHLETMLSEVFDLFGVDAVIKVAVFDTYCSDIDLFPALTGSIRFRKNQQPCAHDQKLIDRILSDKTSGCLEVIYDSCLGGCIQGCVFAGMSNDAKSQPFLCFMRHFNAMIEYRKPNLEKGTELVRMDEAFTEWSALPLSLAVESTHGRSSIRTLIKSLCSADEHNIFALKKFWHQLGPARYDFSDVVRDITSHPVFLDECRRLFVDPGKAVIRIKAVDTEYLWSSFQDVKEMVSLQSDKLNEEELKSVMLHYGVPVQNKHIEVLINLTNSVS